MRTFNSISELEDNMVKQAEIYKIARKIARANSALNECISSINEVISDKMISQILNDFEEHEDTIRRLAFTYDKLNKKYVEFINAGFYARNFDDFDSLTNKISAVLENGGFEDESSII